MNDGERNITVLAVRRHSRRLLGWAAGGLLVTWAAHSVGVDPGLLFNEAGQKNAAEIAGGLQTLDTSPEFLERIWRLIQESLAIGALGLLLALLLGIPLALVAARIPSLSDAPGRPRWVRVAQRASRSTARTVLLLLRSIPEIIWAFLFVRILGLGPGPAVLAIGLTFAGIIGKLYAELMEAASPAPVRALLASGATRTQALIYGVFPQVKAQWIGYGLFRFECALRSASILGVVGAGGIGAEIDLSIRYFKYDKLATALLAVLGCVALFEVLSAGLRRVAARWSMLLVVLGSWWGAALLEIPWAELFSDSALQQAKAFLSGFAELNLTPEFLSRAASLVLETLAMALVGTSLAAACAFVLAPLAARQLTIDRFSTDVPGRRGWAWAPALLIWTAVRGLFQVTRALPELVWALLFVVWLGPGPFAGALAVGAHTVGILGRLFGEVYEEVEVPPARAVERLGASRLGIWAYAILPQVAPRLASYALFRFEVNVRATAMVGFVGAGGIGDALHTAISLFHMADLATLLATLLVTVAAVDWIGDRLRARLIA